jgi:hypothetical protein
MRNPTIRSFSALFLTLLAPTAFALNNRSAVSVNGLDTNSCITTSPCRSFSYAMTQTNPAGEIIALDSAGYGPFTIGLSMTISGAPGIHAAITTTSGDGIAITGMTSITVILRNLVLIGAGGSIGIHQTYALNLRVIGCLIRGFGTAGIKTESQGGNLTVHHTAVLDNTAGTGIQVSGGLGTNLATITDSTIEGNDVGVEAEYNTKVVVANSTITGNTTGAQAESTLVTSGLAANLVLEGCTIGHNSTGILANASGSNNTASVYISHDVVAFNATGVSSSGASTVYSYLDNRFAGNGADGGPFTTILFK